MQAFVLGTAQWGNAYGVTNTQGRLTDQQIADIATLALESGIKFADTAAGYGDAETRLAPWAHQFEVTTKVVGASSISIEEQLATSLDALGLEQVRCCLIHNWPSLTKEQAKTTVEGLESARKNGLVTRVGISGYEEADLIRAIDIFSELGAVQVPVSILDQRLVNSSVIQRLQSAGTEIQARSIFLQGLLASRSASTLGKHPDIENFHNSCERLGVSPIQVALAFVEELEWVNQIVVGSTSTDELREILSQRQSGFTQSQSVFEKSGDFGLIDPRNWKP